MSPINSGGPTFASNLESCTLKSNNVYAENIALSADHIKDLLSFIYIQKKYSYKNRSTFETAFNCVFIQHK